jgi:hypothetical protein
VEVVPELKKSILKVAASTDILKTVVVPEEFLPTVIMNIILFVSLFGVLILAYIDPD